MCLPRGYHIKFGLFFWGDLLARCSRRAPGSVAAPLSLHGWSERRSTPGVCLSLLPSPPSDNHVAMQMQVAPVAEV
eukprot:3512235-Pyramimonas_sp.AAC.1